MNLKSLENLERIEEKLFEIREILNPEDAPYICDTIVTNINDKDLLSLMKEMLIRMGYKKKTIVKVNAIVKEIQS